MRDRLLSLLSHESAALWLAALLAAVCLALWQQAAATWVLVLVGSAALALAVGSIRHLVALARTRRLHPAPGRLIDVGGHRMHLLAHGDSRPGQPAIVWFAGGHAGGFAIHHLHRALRDEARSILIDRPGTGWSDVGPFPRTTAREAEEVVRALERAGETGPFIFAGHSFGGLLCANIARRRPDLVHTLVLLDATPLETIIFGPRFTAIREMQRAAWLGGLAHLVGIDLAARQRRQQASNAHYAQVLQGVDAALGPEVAAVRPVDAKAGHCFASASIYRELSPEGAADCAWETGVYDGDLGDLPVLLVAPKNDIDAQALPESDTGGGAEAQRAMRRLAASRERYLSTSTRSQRVLAPPRTGHNFIYEAPDFVADVVRGVLRSKP
jgi:pimeloyl-ACP methyl ester carboxylesterase